jgi:hypothetical protein
MDNETYANPAKWTLKEFKEFIGYKQDENSDHTITDKEYLDSKFYMNDRRCKNV